MLSLVETQKTPANLHLLCKGVGRPQERVAIPHPPGGPPHPPSKHVTRTDVLGRWCSFEFRFCSKHVQPIKSHYV